MTVPFFSGVRIRRVSGDVGRGAAPSSRIVPPGSVHHFEKTVSYQSAWRSVVVHQLGRNELRPYRIREMMHFGMLLILQDALDFTLHVFGLGKDFALERWAIGDPGVQRADAANRGVQAVEKLVCQTS